MNYSVIWDWNGTLLDDVRVSVQTVNGFLTSRGLKPVTLSYYRNHFTFPVRDFYEKIGISFSHTGNEFDEMSKQFIKYYFENLSKAKLHTGVKETLQFLRDTGFRQFVLSAMEQSRLEKSLKDYGIFSFFEGVQGLDDLYAEGKTEAGKELIRKYNIDPSAAWMVGDTLHDLEVAKSLGTRCVLFSGGHYSPKRLHNQKVPVADNYEKLRKFFRKIISR